MTNESKEVIYKGRKFKFWDIAKLVRHQILTLESIGSSPIIPAKIYWKRESASSKLTGAIAPNSRDKSPKSRGFYRSQVGKAPDSDSGDHRFESCHSSQTIRSVDKNLRIFILQIFRRDKSLYILRFSISQCSLRSY